MVIKHKPCLLMNLPIHTLSNQCAPLYICISPYKPYPTSTLKADFLAKPLHTKVSDEYDANGLLHKIMYLVSVPLSKVTITFSTTPAILVHVERIQNKGPFYLVPT